MKHADPVTGWSFECVTDSAGKPPNGGLVLRDIRHDGHNFAKDVRVIGLVIEVEHVTGEAPRPSAGRSFASSVPRGSSRVRRGRRCSRRPSLRRSGRAQPVKPGHNDEVDFLAGGLMRHHLGQKGDKLGTGVTRGGAADHLAAARLQRRVKAKRAVPVIFKPMALRAPGRKRQHMIQAVQRLHRALLIHAKHRRMHRRFSCNALGFHALSPT